MKVSVSDWPRLDPSNPSGPQCYALVLLLCIRCRVSTQSRSPLFVCPSARWKKAKRAPRPVTSCPPRSEHFSSLSHIQLLGYSLTHHVVHLPPEQVFHPSSAPSQAGLKFYLNSQKHAHPSLSHSLSSPFSHFHTVPFKLHHPLSDS